MEIALLKMSLTCNRLKDDANEKKIGREGGREREREREGERERDRFFRSKLWGHHVENSVEIYRDITTVPPIILIA